MQLTKKQRRKEVGALEVKEMGRDAARRGVPCSDPLKDRRLRRTLEETPEEEDGTFLGGMTIPDIFSRWADGWTFEIYIQEKKRAGS